MSKEQLLGLEFKNQAILNSILDARDAHFKNQNDIAHDWDHHHLPVISNVIKITNQESFLGNTQIEMVLIAAAWHDYKRHSGDFQAMSESLSMNGFSLNSIKNIENIIAEHSHDSKRHTNEGRLLWAADKIEYVSKDRYMAALSVLTGLKINAYKMIWRLRLPSVISEFNRSPFKSAKQIFTSKLTELVEFVKVNNPEDLNWFEGFI